MKKISSGIFALILLSFSLGTPAFAAPRDKVPTLIEKRKEARCEGVIRRIDNRIAAYNNNKDRHLNEYRKVKERALALADRLDGRGYDTSKIRADAQTLNVKIVKAAQDYDSFIAKLEEAKAQDCGDAQGIFRKTMGQSREFLKTFRASVADIRTFIRTVLHPDIKALRSQTPKVAPTG